MTELAANAVEHTSGTFSVDAELSATTLRITVTDRGGGASEVAVREVDATTQSGRGLLILDAVSTGWGVVDHPIGTSVWFDVAWRLAGAASVADEGR